MQSDIDNFISTELEYLADEVLDFFDDDFGFTEDDEVTCDASEELSTVVTKTEEPSLTISTCNGAPTPAGALTIPPSAKNKSKYARKYPDVLKEEQLAKMRKNHRRLTLQQSNPAKEILSRSVCNSIHNAYPLMFMNTINSSDLSTVQNYFAAFMSGPCTFLVRQKINRHYGLPNALSAFGPQLFTHYLLGCFVSFPDMAIRMRDSRAITSGGKTRIVIDVSVSGTKIFDLPEYEWAPDVEKMPELYHSHSSACSGSSSGDSSSDSSVCTEDVTPKMAAKALKTKQKAGTVEETQVRALEESSIASSIDVTISNDLSATVGKGQKKKSKCKIKLPMMVPSAENVAAAQRVPRIPQEYVAATVEHARVMPVPQALYTLGSITMLLDEHNCMQQVLINLEERSTNQTSVVCAKTTIT